MEHTNDNALKPHTVLHGKYYTYVIEKELGQGTFGITYLATTRVKVTGALGELETTIQVAIKEFFMRDMNGRTGNRVTCGTKAGIYYDYKRQFVREAENLSQFNHPHIVKVLEAFEENDTAYFTMEFIEGGSLHEYIQQNGYISDREALELIVQIGDALSAMHANKMLHLDLKPLNIMRRGNGELVLIDFGLSKQFDENGEPESSTRIGYGTRGYAPIEQANYKRGAGFPATLDIYALGATLFKILTGMTPPEASEILNEGFPEEDMQKKGIENELIRLTSWAMEPMWSKRPQSIAAFLTEVKRILPMASGEPHQRTRTTSESATTQPLRTIPNDQVYEECNGFQIRWKDGLSKTHKKLIRTLIGKMEEIGHKEHCVREEGGMEYITHKRLMSLGDKTLRYLIPLAKKDITEQWHFYFNLTQIIHIVNQLEHWTGLPFRLAEASELKLMHTGQSVHTEFEQGTLCYSPDRGLQYKPIGGNYLQDYDATRYYPLHTFTFQLVCEGHSSVYTDDGWFNVPYTQPANDEISPIGFGLYKVRKDMTWNITSPESPMYSFLPECYDKISTINVHHVPGGGFKSGFDYFGVMAHKGDITSYYEFNRNAFKLIESLSRKEIEERATWT